MNEQIVKLARQLRYTQFALIACIIGLAAIAAAPANDIINAREIHIQSASGHSELVLKADDQATGMWITDQQNKAGQVAIYHSGDQAVLGAYKSGQNQPTGANNKTLFDVALASTPIGSGLTINGNGQQFSVAPNNGKLDMGNSDFDIRFVPMSGSSASRTLQR